MGEGNRVGEGNRARTYAPLTAVLFGLLLALGAGGAPRVGSIWAQPVPGGDWEPTGLTVRTVGLFTPASGAFFAQTADGLERSDDGGVTWAPVTLPAPPGRGDIRQVAVDPTNHTVLYASGAEGIYKSGDDAASWELVLPTTNRVLRIAVSPADPSLVFAAFGRDSSAYEFWRSGDAGASWERLAGPNNATLCFWNVPVLEPHPTNADRVFQTFGCYAGRDVPSGDSLDHSTDRGASFAALFRERPLFPSDLVGGGGSAPSRWYLAGNVRAAPGAARLFRSDDDGASWAEVFATPAGPSIGGLAYDPANPDRVHVGLLNGAVMTSANGGASWRELGRQNLGQLNDLALGVDGQNLYAATVQGVWRMRLMPGGPGGDAPTQLPRGK